MPQVVTLSVRESAARETHSRESSVVAKFMAMIRDGVEAVGEDGCALYMKPARLRSNKTSGTSLLGVGCLFTQSEILDVIGEPSDERVNKIQSQIMGNPDLDANRAREMAVGIARRQHVATIASRAENVSGLLPAAGLFRTQVGDNLIIAYTKTRALVSDQVANKVAALDSDAEKVEAMEALHCLPLDFRAFGIGGMKANPVPVAVAAE